MSRPTASIDRSSETVVVRLKEEGLYDLVVEIARQHRVAVGRVLGKERTARVVAARHAVWYTLRQHGDVYYSYPELGRIFGVDHTSIMHAVRLFATRLGTTVRNRPVRAIAPTAEAVALIPQSTSTGSQSSRPPPPNVEER